MTIPDGHPEAACRRCGGPNITWSAPSPLWNQVMRGGDIGGAELFDGIVCPVCFAGLAAEVGVAQRWTLTAEHVSTVLQTELPDGRIWDEHAGLWQTPEQRRERIAEAIDRARYWAALPAAVYFGTSAARPLTLLPPAYRDQLVIHAVLAYLFGHSLIEPTALLEGDSPLPDTAIAQPWRDAFAADLARALDLATAARRLAAGFPRSET